MEIRYLECDRVAVSRAKEDGPSMIVGYGARFYDPKDSGTEYQLYADRSTRVVERIAPGAFARAVKEDDCRALFNHDSGVVLGRSTAGTLRLTEDTRGLRYEIDPPDTQFARDLMASIARGDITGSSFAFDIAGEEFVRTVTGDDELIVRTITGVKIHDVGPVTYPAYTSASAGVRSAGPVDIEALIRRARAVPASAKAQMDAARARVRMMEINPI